jgi:hypothetical protein
MQKVTIPVKGLKIETSGSPVSVGNHRHLGWVRPAPQIWQPFPAPYPYTGSQGPVRGASTGLERPTPWISDLTGEDIEPDESGSPTVGCRFLKDAARRPHAARENAPGAVPSRSQ